MGKICYLTITEGPATQNVAHRPAATAAAAAHGILWEMQNLRPETNLLNQICILTIATDFKIWEALIQHSEFSKRNNSQATS